MMLRTKGNIIDLAESGSFDLIIQGCNCFNTMGSGLAKEIRARYPDAYEADQQTTAGDRTKLGNFSAAIIDKDGHIFVIVNAYTQYHYNLRGAKADLFEYEALGRVLDKIRDCAGHTRIGIPMIGMGLAGGDPERIMPMIEKFAQDCTDRGGSVTLVEFA